MKACFESAHGAQIERKKVEKQGPVSLGGKRDHLPLVRGHFKDLLQVGRLAAQTGAIVDQFTVDFLGREVNETQGIPYPNRPPSQPIRRATLFGYTTEVKSRTREDRPRGSSQ